MHYQFPFYSYFDVGRRKYFQVQFQVLFYYKVDETIQNAGM
jgi:hypothetical protein